MKEMMGLMNACGPESSSQENSEGGASPDRNYDKEERDAYKMKRLRERLDERRNEYQKVTKIVIKKKKPGKYGPYRKRYQMPIEDVRALDRLKIKRREENNEFKYGANKYKREETQLREFMKGWLDRNPHKRSIIQKIKDENLKIAENAVKIGSSVDSIGECIAKLEALDAKVNDNKAAQKWLGAN